MKKKIIIAVLATISAVASANAQTNFWYEGRTFLANGMGLSHLKFVPPGGAKEHQDGVNFFALVDGEVYERVKNGSVWQWKNYSIMSSPTSYVATDFPPARNATGGAMLFANTSLSTKANVLSYTNQWTIAGDKYSSSFPQYAMLGNNLFAHNLVDLASGNILGTGIGSQLDWVIAGANHGGYLDSSGQLFTLSNLSGTPVATPVNPTNAFQSIGFMQMNKSDLLLVDFAGEVFKYEGSGQITPLGKPSTSLMTALATSTPGVFEDSIGARVAVAATPATGSGQDLWIKTYKWNGGWQGWARYFLPSGRKIVGSPAYATGQNGVVVLDNKATYWVGKFVKNQTGQVLFKWFNQGRP